MYDLFAGSRLQDALEALDPGQRAAATAEFGPTQVLAGPGTGKTRTLTVRYAVVRDRGVKGDRIFVSTFTRTSAAEIQQRLAVAFPEVNDPNAAIGTLDALARRLLKRIGDVVGLPEDFRIWDENRCHALMAELGIADRASAGGMREAAPGSGGWFGSEVDPQELCAPEQGPRVPRRPAAERLGHPGEVARFDLFTRWKDRLLWPRDVLLIASGDDPAYERDAELLGAAEDYARYQAGLRDNGAVDLSDLVPLCVEALRSDSATRMLWQSRWDEFLIDESQDLTPAEWQFVEILAGRRDWLWAVGDEDQSLYSWRSADPEMFLRFPERHPGARVVTLERNYRSTPAIVAASSRLIAHNSMRSQKAIVAVRPEGGPIRVETYDSDLVEAEAKADSIAGSLGQGTPLTEIAVACRVSARSLPLQLALRGRGVPFRVRGGRDAREQPAVRAVSGLLRFVMRGPEDPEAIPLLGGGEKAEMLLRVGEQLREEQWGERPWEELCRFVGTAVVRACPYRKTTDRALLWISTAHAAGRLAEACGSFLGWLRMLSRNDDPDTAAVIVSTIHGLKGLEFDEVHLIGCEEDVLPSRGAVDSEEERCAMFVAISRPRLRLCVSHAAIRGGKAARPSPYLAEAFGQLKPEHVEWVRPGCDPKPKDAMPASAPPVTGPARRLEWSQLEAPETVAPASPVDGPFPLASDPAPRQEVAPGCDTPVYIGLKGTGLALGPIGLLELAIVDGAGPAVFERVLRVPDIPSRVQRETGITPDQSHQSAAWSEVRDVVATLLSKRLVVCHNAAAVQTMLGDVADVAGGWVCTRKWALDGRGRLVSLRTLAAECGHTDSDRSHRAVGDALALRAVWAAVGPLPRL